MSTTKIKISTSIKPNLPKVEIHMPTGNISVGPDKLSGTQKPIASIETIIHKFNRISKDSPFPVPEMISKND